MNFVLKPSLEQLALVKIVVSLWNQNDVRALIAKLRFSPTFSPTNKKWKKIEESIIMKVPHFSLPLLLEEKVLGIIKPVDLQILKWILFHRASNIPVELCWTPRGTVDRKRTAEVLVSDENLDISTRYKLACTYCLEDDILEFWNKMPEELKESVSYKYPIINFWSYNMTTNELDSAHTSYISEFEQCANQCNTVAVEYFLQKLTPREREKSLVKTAKYIRDAEVLCFLLSKMDEAQQMVVFKNDPYGVLECFLQWPFQNFFIEIANCMWDFLSKENFEYILRAIIGKVKNGYKDWNYQKLFREFWQQSPSNLKSSFIDEIDESRVVPYLFEIKDKENIRLILKDAPLVVKEKLIHSDEMIFFFLLCSFCDNEWDFLEFFIRECFPSKDEMLKFKEEFEKRVCDYSKKELARNKQNWDQLFHLCCDSNCMHNKRSAEGENCSSKQFCCLQ